MAENLGEMKLINEVMERYGGRHQNPTNIMLARIFIPVTMLGILAMMSCIPFFHWVQNMFPFVNYGFCLILVVYAYYMIALSFPLAISYLLLGEAMVVFNYGIAKLTGDQFIIYAIVVTLIGIIGQMVGNGMEQKKTNLPLLIVSTLTGFAWTISFFFRKRHLEIDK